MMKEVRVQPDVYTFTTMIQMFVGMGNVEEVGKPSEEFT
jgi:hypothetical protein